MIYFKSVREQRFVAGSQSLSNLFSAYVPLEPSLNETFEASRNGIYLGRSEKLATPIFLDLSSAINPHLFIAGITGSGKSYLMKSIVLRMSLMLEISTLLIDFTGEYRDVAGFLFCKTLNYNGFEDIDFEREKGILYMDLSTLGKEDRKIGCASAALKHITVRMRSFRADGKIRMFVLLDEAWKILSKDTILETMIREGRKYGVGLILASQILSDIDKEFLQNIGTLFVFRVQSNSSLQELLGDYNLTADQLVQIQNFELGRCLFIQLDKFKKRSCFVISKIDGVRLENSVKIDLDSNILEVGEGALYAALENMGVGKDTLGEIKAEISRSSLIELSKLVKRLISSGLERRAMLFELRRLGISDNDIADAFAQVVG